MKLLVAYYNFNNGGGHGRDRVREHVPNERDKPLCGAAMKEADEYPPALLWKIIDSQPKRLCSRCAEMTKQPTDAERLKAWNAWAQSPEQ